MEMSLASLEAVDIQELAVVVISTSGEKIDYQIEESRVSSDVLGEILIEVGKSLVGLDE